jgi:hypothetical protein
MKSKKQLRALAAKNERERRNAKTLSNCPISREEYEELVSRVSDHLVENKHSGDFTISQTTCKELGVSFEELASFLDGKGIKDDWSLFVKGDPYTMFGSANGRRARMPLEEEELELLLDWVDSQIEAKGCDHTHKFTKQWLENNNHPTTRITGALMALGGICDCEVAMNIEPEGIYS